MPTTAEKIATLQAYIAQATAEINRLWSTQGFSAGVRIQGLRDGITRSQQEIARLQASGGSSVQLFPVTSLPSGATTTTAVSSAPNSNFVNAGDSINFYLEVNMAATYYSVSQTNDFRTRLASDGLRPVVIDDSGVRLFFGGTLTGQCYAEHGYGALDDVARRIAGMAVAAGFRVNYSGSSPRVVKGSPVADTINPGKNPDNTPSSGSLDKIIKDLKDTFKVDGTTLALGALVVFMIMKNR